MGKKKTSKKQARHKKSLSVPKIIGILFCVFIFSSILTFGAIYGVNRGFFVGDSDDTPTAVDEPVDIPEEPVDEMDEEPEAILKEVDFQPVVDTWVKTVGGNKSILIYDLDLDKVVGEYNIKENYNTASLYKLFVVYEGYKRLENGTWDGSAKAGSTGKTISKCLDLAIRESHSPCAETLWGMIGRDKLDTIIEDEWEITGSDISKLTSNVNDIVLIMKRFYEHPDFNDSALLDAMWDSFLNQPNTTYEWRQGLPRGFSKADVYNKVGWDYNAEGKYWNIYHDAAIVKFPLADGTTRNFIVIVMTNKIDFKDIRKFGTDLENKFYEEIEI